MRAEGAEIPRPTARLTVGIATRNRPDSLIRCVRSLVRISDLVAEIIVVDDTSDQEIEAPLLEALGADFPIPLTYVRQEHNEGYIVARNAIVRRATTEFVLILDDDAYIIEADSIDHGLDVISRDPRVAAVGFAQAESTGVPWPREMQPSTASFAAIVPTFIGFAHLLKRSVFLEFGGYREQFVFYGEEKEYCVRLLDAGYVVVYLPDALVAHVSDPRNRNLQRHIHYVSRNDCLNSIYNDPIPLLFLSIPRRLHGFLSMRRSLSVHDPGGFRRLLLRLASDLRTAVSQRRPLKWATFRRWRELRRSPEPYVLIDARTQK